MKVRAKFRCNSVQLQRASAETPEYKAIVKEMDLSYGTAASDAVAQERGVDRYRSFDQPTIKMSAVVGADGTGNESWSSATPNGNLEMTITNPDAAEQFELGEFYFLDFTKA